MTKIRFSYMATCGVAVVLGCAATTANAALIAYDSFSVDGMSNNDYEAGAVQGQNPSVGNAGFSLAWTSAVGSTGTQQAYDAALTHPNMPGTPATGVGTTLHGLIVPASNTGGANRRVSRDINFVPADATYYASFLLQYAVETDPDATNYVGFGVKQGTDGNYDAWAGSYVGIYGGGIDFYKGTGVPATAETTTLVDAVTIGQTYMVVLEINYSTLSSDSITVKIYDSSSTQVADETFTGLDVDLDYLVLGSRGHSEDATRSDEFRFGTELDDVFFTAPVPEPGTNVLLACGLLGLLAYGRRCRRS